MELQLETIDPGRRTRVLLTGGIAVTVVIAARCIPDLTALLPPCPFRLLSGIPCPFCGAARCAVHLANLKPLAAAGTSPFFFLVYLWWIASTAATAAGLLLQRMPTVKLSRRESSRLRRIVVLLIGFNWIYLLVETLLREH